MHFIIKSWSDARFDKADKMKMESTRGIYIHELYKSAQVSKQVSHTILWYDKA